MAKRRKIIVGAILAPFVVIAIDMLAGRSPYHPLVHVYRFMSWGICKSTAAGCQYDDNLSSPKVGQAAVATSHHEATQVGIDILSEGGNAIDAAVAVGYALAVVHPCCGNLGGGGFMTLRLSDKTTRFINFRETAPLAAAETLYQDSEGKVVEGLSTDGYLAVATPGTVAGLEYAREKYGSGNFTREELISPAQSLAEEGFTLSEPGQKLLSREMSETNKDSEVSAIFTKQGEPLNPGDRLVQKDLAQTLALIASEGSSAFYNGKIAERIVTDSQENGGILTMRDFATYQVQDTEPLNCDYRGFTIVTAPPPGGGSVLCQMLNVVEGYPIGESEYQSAQHLHWMLSAMLFAYRDRNLYFGDPDFSDIPLDRILSDKYAEELRTQVPRGKAVKLEDNFPKTREGANTTHFSIVDGEGNAVAVTYTINTLFGSGIIAPETGFFLNNEMDDFTAKVGEANSYGLVQSEANRIEPGKRPLSSMTPTILMDANDNLYFVTGSPGGPTIPTTVFQIITNLIDFELSPYSAVNQPRIHYQGVPNIVLSEPFGVPGDSFVDLWEYGYKVSPFINWGAAMSTGHQGKESQAVKDFRRVQGEATSIDLTSE
ncbi:gamma-glutamyltransferase [cf. Phormidesmis sp. LEGE 11477]|nr:gamma-glutamyltransferase [cf. Phormidesmis sp. LEGE 11477]